MNAASLLDTCETTVELAAAVRLLDKRRDSLADDAFASMGASLLSLVERLLGQQLGVFLAAQTSRQQKQENMRLIFAALRELQLVAPGARSQDVAEGRPAQTLNFLWELVVRIQLLRLAEVREATSGATTNAEQPTSPSPTLSPSTLHLALNRPTPTPPPTPDLLSGRADGGHPSIRRPPRVSAQACALVPDAGREAPPQGMTPSV